MTVPHSTPETMRAASVHDTGLESRVQELEARVEALQGELAALRARVDAVAGSAACATGVFVRCCRERDCDLPSIIITSRWDAIRSATAGTLAPRADTHAGNVAVGLSIA